LIILIALVPAGCSEKKSVSQSLLGIKQSPAENHWIKTTDGWSLHIRRYKPISIDPKHEPVILCHGLSHNSNFWDLTEKNSLAKYLQAEGFDVWSVSLRGAGQSTKPTLSQIKQLFRMEISIFNPQGIVNRQPGLLRLNWTVDDHIQKDIPAILDYVLKKTEKKQVSWIGHSMGSMIMFAYLGLHSDAPVKSFVALSAPMYLVRPSNDVFELLADQKRFVEVGNIATGTNLRAVVGTLAGGAIKTPLDHLFLNEANVEPETMHIFYYACQDDISPGQLDQLLQYVKTGNFFSYDGKVNYTDLLGKVNVPTFQIVGRQDNMVDPGFSAEVNRRIGAKTKQLRIIGMINNFRADYGHDDVIIGRYARDDVFPLIRDWLTKQCMASVLHGFSFCHSERSEESCFNAVRCFTSFSPQDPAGT
jgi:pimeloyl-ACP methyl ester carboxylesterase